jgi:hypothetical protein
MLNWFRLCSWVEGKDDADCFVLFLDVMYTMAMMILMRHMNTSFSLGSDLGMFALRSIFLAHGLWGQLPR